MDKELKFSVDSALLQELGEKLVESVHVAVSELVKNSYDADATQIDIVFGTNENGSDFIKIIDNGKGMNHQTVRNYWMRIATTNKEKSNNSTVFGRPLTGAKGIGRFSCRRLGTKLTLETKASRKNNTIGSTNELEYTKVVFPWKDFEAGTDVTDIICFGEENVLKNDTTGTVLTIEGISNEWSSKGLNYLKRQLGVLVANQGTRRKGFKEDKGVTIKLSAPDFESETRDIREDLLNAGWGTLEGFINSKGQAVYELEALGIGKRTIISKTVFTDLTDVRFKIGILIDDRAQMRDKSVVSKYTLSQIIPDWGGVQIRFRNFRVYPYGNDDWLNINRDRGLRKAKPENELFVFAHNLNGVDASRSLLNMLGMQNYVGSVYIGENSKGFIMKANREGFLESQAMKELTFFVRYGVDWSTILRDFHLRQQVLIQHDNLKQRFEETIGKNVSKASLVNTAVEVIRSNVEQIIHKLPKKEQSIISSSLKSASDIIVSQNKSLIVEITHLRLVASASSLLLIFSHEVKSLLGLLERSKNTLFLLAQKLKIEDRTELLTVVDDFEDLNLRLEDLIKLTSLINHKPENKPTRIAIKPRLVKVAKIFDLITNNYNITIDIDEVPNNISIPNIFEAEVYSIFINIISNSIKAVIAGNKEKIINISSIKNETGLTFIIKDTGIGINQSKFSEVFIPFISDPDGTLYANLFNNLNPEDSLFVGSGSGLGLGIVKEIVEANKGSIYFSQPSKPWSTELQITFKN